MATSTFAKEFKVKSEKSKGFVDEMTKKAPPTLKGDFESQLMHAKDLKEALYRALK